jgi:PAS domain S-box-containing protein
MATLTRKLIVSQMITGLVAGALLFLMLQRQISRLITQDFLDQGRISARALAAALGPKIAAHDAAGMESAIEGGVATAEADWAYASDSSGAVEADTFQGKVPDSVRLPIPSGYAGVEQVTLPDDSALFFVVSEPIEGGSAGTIHLGFRELRLQAALRRAQYVMLATILLVVFLGVGTLALIARRHLAPVHALTASARAFARGGAIAWVPIPVESRDEVGVLTEALNHMADTVREQQRQLEVRVKDRTDELTRLNRRLEMDIQLRQRTQEALAEKEKMFHMLTAASPVGIFQADAEGRCTYVNERLERVTGRSAADLSENGWRSIVHPEDLPGALDEWIRAARAGHDFELSLRLVTPKGGFRWVFVRGASIRSAEGHVAGFVGTVEDVSEQQRALRVEGVTAEVSAATEKGIS